MRTGMRTVLAGLLVAGIAVPSAAQDTAEPTVEGYLCIFAGKCEGGDEPAVVSASSDEVSEGFRIARPGAEPAKTTGRPNLAPHSGANSGSRPPRSSAGSTVRTPPRVRDKGNLASGSTAVPNSAPVSATRVSQLPRADLRIGFELNSSRLTADGEKKARIFAQSLLMPELSGKRFLIEGHTDSGGQITLNMNLSQQRAQAVADFLSRQGVDRARMQVRGYGPGNPLPGLRTTDTRNRRVEARLIS